MLTQLFRRVTDAAPDLPASRLYDETTFYPAFLKDLQKCQSEVIIESPFVTNRRLAELFPALKKLKGRGVRVAIVTKDPREHEKDYCREDAIDALASLQRLGIQVIYANDHHRKVAILDRKVLYEGSLNILSQYDSREIMRRIESVAMSWQLVRFIGADRLLN